MKKVLTAAVLGFVVATNAWADVTVRPATAPASAPAPASAESAKALAAAGKWREALSMATKVLDPGTRGVPAFDRQEVLFLRAECLLQLRDGRTAMDVLNHIAQDADKASDVAGASNAMALSYLISKSPLMIFTPKTTADKKPLNILDAANRKTAMEALYADEFAVNEQRVNAAKVGTTLAPVADLVKGLPMMMALERVTSGATSKTDGLMKDVPQAAASIMRSA